MSEHTTTDQTPTPTPTPALAVIDRHVGNPLTSEREAASLLGAAAHAAGEGCRPAYDPALSRLTADHYGWPFPGRRRDVLAADWRAGWDGARARARVASEDHPRHAADAATRAERDTPNPPPVAPPLADAAEPRAWSDVAPPLSVAGVFAAARLLAARYGMPVVTHSGRPLADHLTADRAALADPPAEPEDDEPEDEPARPGRAILDAWHANIATLRAHPAEPDEAPEDEPADPLDVPDPTTLARMDAAAALARATRSPFARVTPAAVSRALADEARSESELLPDPPYTRPLDEPAGRPSGDRSVDEQRPGRIVRHTPSPGCCLAGIPEPDADAVLEEAAERLADAAAADALRDLAAELVGDEPDAEPDPEPEDPGRLAAGDLATATEALLDVIDGPPDHAELDRAISHARRALARVDAHYGWEDEPCPDDACCPEGADEHDDETPRPGLLDTLLADPAEALAFTVAMMPAPVVAAALPWLDVLLDVLAPPAAEPEPVLTPAAEPADESQLAADDPLDDHLADAADALVALLYRVPAADHVDVALAAADVRTLLHRREARP